jgi:hypothetical protein
MKFLGGTKHADLMLRYDNEHKALLEVGEASEPSVF